MKLKIYETKGELKFGNSNKQNSKNCIKKP